jgi:integrase
MEQDKRQAGLSMKGIRGAKPKAGERLVLWDDDVRGLGLRVYPTGRKTFVLKYRDGTGAQRLATVGDFGPYTLDQARDRARAMIREAEEGADPLAVKRAAKAAPTFADLADAYKTRHAPKKLTGAEDLRRINKHLGGWLNRKLSTFTREDVAQLVERIARTPPERGGKAKKVKANRPARPLRTGKPVEANRTLALVRKMFTLAEAWGLTPAGHPNPARGIESRKEVARDRWVAPEELPKLAAAIDAETSPYTRGAIWLYLLLGARKSELLGARWADVDRTRKVLKLPKTKAGRPHEIPLGQAALEIFDTLPTEHGSPFVFPGRTPDKPMPEIRAAWDRVRTAAGVADVRLHDLRRTVGSWLVQSGASLHLVGRVLNHTNQATTARYARFAQDHVRDALEAHATKLLGAAGKLTSAEVHDLDEARKARAAK